MLKRVVPVLAVVAVLLLALFSGVNARVIRPNMIFVPEGVKGVDTSEYQGAVDLKSLSDGGIEFVYAKATEGASHVDPQFAATCEQASGSRVALGAYHFFSFDTVGLVSQVAGLGGMAAGRLEDLAVQRRGQGGGRRQWGGNVDLDVLSKGISVADLLMHGK